MCAVIFCCRILDMSIDTIRMVLTVKEKTGLAALSGFFEAFIWFIVVRQALTSSMTGLPLALAYGGGFAAGTYIGGKIARRVIRTNVVMQVVTSGHNNTLVRAIQQAGFAVTVVNANATEFGGEKYLLFSEITGSQIAEYKQLIHELDPHAFIMVQETKYVYNGFMRK